MSAYEETVYLLALLSKVIVGINLLLAETKQRID